MLLWLVRRAIIAAATFIGATFVLWYIVGVSSHTLTGDPFFLRSASATRFVVTQYESWLKDFLTNSGYPRSVVTGRSAEQMVLERALPTLLLMGAGLLLQVLVAVPLGVLAAARARTRVDLAVNLVAAASIAAPTFVVGLLAIYLFSVVLRVAPSGGLVTAGLTASNPLDIARHLILPASVLAFSEMGRLIRYVRYSVLDALSSNYVLLARATGQSRRQAAFRHALPNALMPLITVVGLQTSRLLAGAFLLEIVFAWPGVGSLAFDAIPTHDYPVLLQFGALAAVVVILGTLAADVAYLVVDPRMRAGAASPETRIGQATVPRRVKRGFALAALALVIVSSSATIADLRRVERQRLPTSPAPSAQAGCGGPAASGACVQPTPRPTTKATPAPTGLVVQLARVNSVLERFDLPAPAPGCAVAVSDHDEVVFQKGFGQANLATGRAIAASTAFDMGAVAEAITAQALLLLARDGRLALDDDVRRYLPELPDVGAYMPLTDLLYNESGVVDLGVAVRLAGHRNADPISSDQVLAALSDYPQLTAIPGRVALKNPANAFLIARIVERVSGEPYADFVADRIFEPLGMGSTSVEEARGQATDGMTPYLATAPASRVSAVTFVPADLRWDVVGATGLRSTVGDLLRWTTNFSSGAVGGRDLVQQQIRVGAQGGGDAGYFAAGLYVKSVFRGTVVYQAGGWPQSGFRASVAMRLADGVASAVGCNVSSIATDQLAQQLLEAWLVV